MTTRTAIDEMERSMERDRMECAAQPIESHGETATQRRLLSLCTLLALLIAGCTGAEKTQRSEEDEFYAKFPPVSFSEESVIHSPEGDMTARLPHDWVSVDVRKLESPQVFAMACNPEYTISLIFSEVPIDNAAKSSFNRAGLRGLAETSFERRRKRSSNRARMVSEMEEFAIGLRKFSAYTYSTDSLKSITRVAVFYTNFHLYECAITHLTFNDRELPTQRTIREIHQLVLGTIEW